MISFVYKKVGQSVQFFWILWIRQVRLILNGLYYFLAFTVEKIDGIHVSIYGLGPLNWIVRRVLRSLLRRHLREFLEKEGRDVVQQELQNAALASDENLFTMLPQLVLLG